MRLRVSDHTVGCLLVPKNMLTVEVSDQNEKTDQSEFSTIAVQAESECQQRQTYSNHHLDSSLIRGSQTYSNTVDLHQAVNHSHSHNYNLEQLDLSKNCFMMESIVKHFAMQGRHLEEDNNNTFTCFGNVMANKQQQEPLEAFIVTGDRKCSVQRQCCSNCGAKENSWMQINDNKICCVEVMPGQPQSGSVLIDVTKAMISLSLDNTCIYESLLNHGSDGGGIKMLMPFLYKDLTTLEGLKLLNRHSKCVFDSLGGKWLLISFEHIPRMHFSISEIECDRDILENHLALLFAETVQRKRSKGTGEEFCIEYQITKTQPLCNEDIFGQYMLDAEKCEYYCHLLKIPSLIGSDYLFNSCTCEQVSDDELSENMHEINSVKHKTYANDKKNVWLNGEWREQAALTRNPNENNVHQGHFQTKNEENNIVAVFLEGLHDMFNNEQTCFLPGSVRNEYDDVSVDSCSTSASTTDDGEFEVEDIDEIPVANSVTANDLFKVPFDISEEIKERDTFLSDSSPLDYDDTMYKSINAWCRGITADDPWELTCPKDEDEYPVQMTKAYNVAEEEWLSKVDGHCSIVDDLWQMSDVYLTKSPIMSERVTHNPRRVYLFQGPDRTISINVVEGSASDFEQGFSSSFLVSCLLLFAFVQKMKTEIALDIEVNVPKMKPLGTWTLGKACSPCMSMKDIALKEVAWLLAALVVNIAAATSPNTEKTELIDYATLKGGLLGLGRAELKNLFCDKASKLLMKAAAPPKDDLKVQYTIGKRFQWENPKTDFLRDVLNIPDCIQPTQQKVEVYPGYEDELTRLASYSRLPVQKWYPAVPLAEKGFYCEQDSSVVCHFCKSKSHTWRRDWNPEHKHEPTCPLMNHKDCGNIPMVPSSDNGKYQSAVRMALDELRMKQLQNKNQVLLRDSKRSLESFKNPQLPENQMGSLSINVTQGEGHQEHDAMEDEPQPSTSGSNSSQQQQEGAGGLRYFVHSYDERGNPISTSQKMEFNSQEERANTSMKKETDRLKTFDNVWKKGDVISPEELAKSGFYYAGTGDRVRCAFCNGVLRNWAVGDRAAAEHRRHYPTCPFVLNLDVGNIPYSPDLSGLHTSTAATTKHTEQRRQTASTQGQQSTQSSVASFGAAITPSAVPGTILIPKHSNFTTVESRLLTYDNWPTSNVQRPQQLAEAGFFYTGSSDNVRCFHCDGGLRNWLDSDLPWVEHAKWFPRCGFLQRVKGVEFVLEETRKHNQQNFTTAVAQNRGSTGLTTTLTTAPGVGIVERPATGGVRRVEAREVRARFDTERVKMLLEMGYKEAVVKYVILQRLRYTGDDFSSTQEMLESVLAEEPNLEEKGIAYYENILQQEFGRPMTIVYPQVTQMTGTLDKTAVPSPAPPMTLTTSASLPIPGDEKSLVEENRQLKEQTTCKICMDNEVSMVFVPCGHLVACADCAPNLRQCPICRRAITGTIRTFLS